MLPKDQAEIDKFLADKKRYGENYDFRKEQMKNNTDSFKDETADARKQKKQETASSAGNVAGAVASAIGNKLNNLRNAGKSVGGPGSSGDVDGGGSGTQMTILFWVALLAHLFDAYTKFQRPGFMIFVYIFMLVYGVIAVYGVKRLNFDEVEFFGFILLAYFLPFLPGFFPDNRWILALSGVIFLFPVLPLYFGIRFPEHNIIHKWSRIYIIFWTLILAFYLITTFSPNQNTQVLIKDPLAGFRFVITGTTNTITKVEGSVATSINRAIAQATGQPYSGDQESKVGIYIDSVKPLESKYNPDSQVFVEAQISAENIKEPIDVNLYCYILGLKQGRTTPPAITGIVDKYQNIVDCDLGQLAKGNYNVNVRVDFEMETTSDIQYTFVSTDVKSDQYATLGIDPTTTAIYTGGPVALGLPALGQPLRLDPTQGNSQLSSYPFGVSLQNMWQQGKVLRGIYYVLDVPDEVKLVDCSRTPIVTREADETGLNRNIYTFNTNTTNAQESFDAVTCRMQFDDVKKLLGNDVKSVKTFVARARYEYSIEGTTPLTIDTG